MNSDLVREIDRFVAELVFTQFAPRTVVSCLQIEHLIGRLRSQQAEQQFSKTRVGS